MLDLKQHSERTIGSFSRNMIACLILAATTLLPQRATAEPSAAFQTKSPFHRAKDADGQTIPCRCSFHGQLVPLGTLICMSTHLGTQIARCDLDVNVTSWVPTGIHCETSQITVPSKANKS
ncbi:MAG: hypothetical protein ABL898_11520 [Hyphomicrobiaceae bacterium]|nr:hypothetical protein [Hyphomicrobiaceae bacterium]